MLRKKSQRIERVRPALEMDAHFVSSFDGIEQSLDDLYWPFVGIHAWLLLCVLHHLVD